MTTRCSTAACQWPQTSIRPHSVCTVVLLLAPIHVLVQAGGLTEAAHFIKASHRQIEPLVTLMPLAARLGDVGAGQAGWVFGIE
ncbi:hypothetical protein HaLaN_25093 [Haematococcus lacustris]|uniref:Uncharacterized protein n=1 Tax=Haematococcus lacustris TaxID=44745 RepID=A0A699ZW14_HAELA|nr:hypothetical protein HaLaN_25093 [Haematococcus lacustris]